MYSTHDAILSLPGLPLSARRAHIVPDLHTKPLLSIGQLCDAGCRVEFTAQDIHVYHNDAILLSGLRSPITKLWTLPLSSPHPMSEGAPCTAVALTTMAVSVDDSSPCLSNAPLAVSADVPCSSPLSPSAVSEGVSYPSLHVASSSVSVGERYPVHSTALLSEGVPSPPPPAAVSEGATILPVTQDIVDSGSLSESANASVSITTPASLVAFAHAALFSPALSTLDVALQRDLLPHFPGLSRETLRRHPPVSIAMTKGHMDQIRQNIRSTKRPGILSLPPTGVNDSTVFDDAFPASEPDANRSHHCFAGIIQPTGQTYSDQTGRFPALSSTGNNYLFVMYDYDSNCIFAEPIASRKASDILTAFKLVHATLCRAGLKPRLHRLDNECDVSLKEFMVDANITFQLTPPHVHRRNAAERAIRTFQNHFIAGLCSTDHNFPIHLWDRLLPQALLTLNLLRTSRINPRLSAYAQVFGAFNFDRTPLGPPGTKVLVHEKPGQRTTWAPHAVEGWYLGPALESYRCFRVWIWDTKTERITDTLEWFPEHVTMPTASASDLLLASLRDVTQALRTASVTSPLPVTADSHVAELKTLVDALSGAPSAVPVSLSPPRSLPSMPMPAPIRKSVTFAPDVPVDPAALPRHFRSVDTPFTAVTRRRPRRKAKTKTHHNHHRAPQHQHGTRANKTVELAATATLLSPPNADSAFLHHALHGNALNPDTGKVAEYPELSRSSDGPQWVNGNDEEVHRLAQGFGHIPGSNTIHFISIKDIPKGMRAAYVRVVCAYRPEKENPFRVRWCIGGDQIHFAGDKSTKTAALETAKLLFNSVLSTPGAKDYYLGTILGNLEYIRIPVSILSQHIIDHYNLEPLIHNGFVYAAVSKGMYGLPQAGKLANDQLSSSWVSSSPPYSRLVA